MAGSKNGLPVLMDLGNKLKIDWVVLTDDDGIMNCDSRVKSHKSLRNVPRIFAFLMDNGIMASDDVTRLQAIPKIGQRYKNEKFTEIKAIAQEHGIFSLDTKLEDALRIKVNRRDSKIRGVLEAVEDSLRRNDIPSVFIDFLSFVRETKRKKIYMKSYSLLEKPRIPHGKLEDKWE